MPQFSDLLRRSQSALVHRATLQSVTATDWVKKENRTLTNVRRLPATDVG